MWGYVSTPTHTSAAPLQVEELTRSAAAQLDARATELNRTKSELTVARSRLQHAETGQASAERQAADLRRTMLAQQASIASSGLGAAAEPLRAWSSAAAVVAGAGGGAGASPGSPARHASLKVVLAADTVKASNYTDGGAAATRGGARAVGGHSDSEVGVDDDGNSAHRAAAGGSGENQSSDTELEADEEV